MGRQDLVNAFPYTSKKLPTCCGLQTKTLLMSPVISPTKVTSFWLAGDQTRVTSVTCLSSLACSLVGDMLLRSRAARHQLCIAEKQGAEFPVDTTMPLKNCLKGGGGIYFFAAGKTDVEWPVVWKAGPYSD